MEDRSCKTQRWQLLKALLNNLSPEAFQAKMASNPTIKLVDVRTPEEFTLWHLPGAVNLSYLQEDFIDQLEKLNPAYTYLVYCRSGRRSIRACTFLRNGGFPEQQIFNLDGGLNAWLEAYPNSFHSM